MNNWNSWGNLSPFCIMLSTHIFNKIKKKRKIERKHANTYTKDSRSAWTQIFHGRKPIFKHVQIIWKEGNFCANFVFALIWLILIHFIADIYTYSAQFFIFLTLIYYCYYFQFGIRFQQFLLEYYLNQWKQPCEIKYQ